MIVAVVLFLCISSSSLSSWKWERECDDSLCVKFCLLINLVVFVVCGGVVNEAAVRWVVCGYPLARVV